MNPFLSKFYTFFWEFYSFGLACWSLSHFRVIFVYSARWPSNLIGHPLGCPVGPALAVKKTFVSPAEPPWAPVKNRLSPDAPVCLITTAARLSREALSVLTTQSLWLQGYSKFWNFPIDFYTVIDFLHFSMNLGLLQQLFRKNERPASVFGEYCTKSENVLRQGSILIIANLWSVEGADFP